MSRWTNARARSKSSLPPLMASSQRRAVSTFSSDIAYGVSRGLAPHQRSPSAPAREVLLPTHDVRALAGIAVAARLVPATVDHPANGCDPEVSLPISTQGLQRGTFDA